MRGTITPRLHTSSCYVAFLVLQLNMLHIIEVTEISLGIYYSCFFPREMPPTRLIVLGIVHPILRFITHAIK